MRIFETFAPVSLFFHVRDKYQPAFIGHDQGVSTGASYVYILIFTTCGEKDHCWLSQTTMALRSKSSVRTIQNYLNELVKTDYISIRKDEHGRNIYTLLLSDRLIALLGKLGIPTHDMQTSSNASARGAHEKFSHDIRVNKKQDITPLSPLPVQEVSPSPSCRNRTGHPESAPLPQRVSRRGDFSSLSRTNATPHAPRVLHRPAVSHEFEQLWLAWPQTATWDMPRNKRLALRVYRRMERAGQLPPIENLLATVELYKRTDSRWLNGYPPELSNWLHSRQFEKAPLMRRPKKTFFGKLVPAEPVLTPEERRQAEVYRARIEELQKRFNQPTVSASPTPSQDADALIALWPEPERQRVPVTTYLNYLSGKGQKPDLARLVSLARDYLSGTSSPMSLVGWLRSCQACAV